LLIQDCLSVPSRFLQFVTVSPSGLPLSPERVSGLSFV
jgi:hypothetical protein